MPMETRTLVIRTYRPWLRRCAWAGALLLVVAAAYLAFEIGRRTAGYDSLSAWQEQRALKHTIRRLETSNAALRARAAELETGQVSGRQERAELARTVAELQGKLSRQNQDLAFYRGLVSASAGGTKVRIQRVVVSPRDAHGRYSLRVVLVQTVRPQKNIAGTLMLTIEGTEQNKPTSYPLERLAADGRDHLRFSFRYFEELDQHIKLPAGFEPARIRVEVRAEGRTGEPLAETFPWRVQQT